MASSRKPNGRQEIRVSTWKTAERLYVTTDVTTGALAELMDCHASTVSHYIKEHGWRALRAAHRKRQEELLSEHLDGKQHELAEKLAKAMESAVEGQTAGIQLASASIAILAGELVDWRNRKLAWEQTHPPEPGQLIGDPYPVRCPLKPTDLRALLSTVLDTRAWEALTQGRPSDVQELRVQKLDLADIIRTIRPAEG